MARQVGAHVLPLVDDAPLYVGLAAGVFADFGLDVRPMLVKTGSEAVKLIADGKVPPEPGLRRGWGAACA